MCQGYQRLKDERTSEQKKYSSLKIVTSLYSLNVIFEK